MQGAIKFQKMTGQCYPNSFKLLTRLHQAGEVELDPKEKEIYKDLRLVHGNVTPDEGPESGCVIDHAWVEMAGYAYESSYSADNPSTCLIKEYEIKYSVRRREAYTFADARQWFQKSKMFGPWDDDGRTQRKLPL